MNWKFWSLWAEVQALREEKKTLSQALWSVCAERDALRNTERGKKGNTMNWKFWTWQPASVAWAMLDERTHECLRLQKENAALAEAVLALRVELGANRSAMPEVNAMLDKWQRPVGEQREAAAKLQEGLGALSETHPSWVAVMLFIEMQRRFAHVDTAAPFTSDREAWIAIGREQGIERVQMGLVKALIEAKKGKG